MAIIELTFSNADGSNPDVSTIEMEEFIALNTDGPGDEFPGQVRALKLGETLTFGGGAACLSIVKRIS